VSIKSKRPSDDLILSLKWEGLSFREVSERLGIPLGSVTSRYYRLKGVRHPSQMATEIKQRRRRLRLARNREKSSAAIQAAIDLRSGTKLSSAIGTARMAGASLEMIGACLGISKQALHKQCRRQGVGHLGRNPGGVAAVKPDNSA
jgi:hypothetical protein